jgi:hypothetical protein
MAKTFGVYSGGSFAPSFGEVQALGRTRLQEQLQARDIWTTWTLTLELREFSAHARLPVDPAAPFICESGQYIWLYFPETDGGVDITMTAHPSGRGAGLQWKFRRSAGQPGIIAFAYGIMAAVLAELTDGVVDSFDNAWDPDRLPAKAEDFYKWYFQPAQALTPEFARWSRDCLQDIRRHRS